MTELPASWIRCAIGDVLNSVQMTRKNETDRDIWYVDISSIDNQCNRIIDPKRLKLSEAPSRARQKIITGDVLFSTVRPYLRKIAAVSDRYDNEIASTGFAVLRGASGIDAKYLYYKAISHDFVSALTGEQYGVSYPAVKEEQVKAQPLELPPTNEQHRIVDKIEAMFEKIEKGVENLRAAKATLALYRQSLLKSAFDGRLTADWRAQNADKLEDPKTLLSRIQKARDTRYKAALDDWQTAVAEWRANGERGRKPAKPKRLPEFDPAEVSVTDEGWADLPLGALIGDVQQGWSPKCDDARPIGPDDWTVVTTTAVQHRTYSDQEIKLLPSRFEPRPEIEIKAGDFLMTRKGPRVRTGVVCLVPKTRHRIMLCDTVYRFRCDETAILPRLLEFALNSPLTLREIDELKSGISDSGISLNHGKIKSVLVKFPLNKAEQAEIARILDARLHAAAKMEAEIDASLTRADALRQSILKQAFAGKLVPQDPTDEPATTLLARIKAERGEAKKKPSTTKTRKIDT